ncbi:MAG: hypothetical protein B6D59_05515 [Campylobacteraceae bacterium 4484_4]|nr:MAG: hypothetical protein B6D59_05515 [Campylobacteraceae bacterium 4484_4]
MQNIVVTLVFSIVVLMFMVYPALKIVEWIERKKKITQRTHNILLFTIAIFLSLVVGIWLQMSSTSGG